ncbi:TPA: tRNA pseudouridine(13) synthase TruD [Legionella pneumophila]|uniref:tRNA pseudouridine synthase D n=1 Tax=Legionella pneumophila (strain Lens) TaxID=297245 RepID=TRUD_LEGPL|nr:tRNA pseudouridine(13) synthase TruD [Legionella pneumophila]Q5WWQ2.1 RecName: Full=tRNA pseudouridine synthase D; AltName: Full=tRNA pseudouridine(13) synthase; AltName: Full=tRNA pseudouridylate synthase D; AltName: Full=tRNA-uridine isomerase D [Legionella pneumophila str. Lens]AOW52007.1 tRNA pseudouridine(13) synthase TruD [Legionella pneumophila subsp. pneumophila]AOW54401.1 tRNA pseudouridine(13) synthase TruD [Legionella pneumophila subsp. pneumophila]AOW57305.1 tRNA pseudouridine(13
MYSLNWPRAYGIPNSTATFKLCPEDFQVNELFEGQFSGEGEHIVLKIEKKGLTTEQVIKSLARLINKPIKLISYAGLKDKQALTTQWLSIHAPGEVIEGIETLEAPGWKILECTRHNKKLRPGFLSGNHFTITLRNVSDESDLIHRIEQIKFKGVPNYFGEQRFGRDGGNLIKAEEILVQGRKVKDRFLKGMYFSAARSWLYNLILSRRVKESSWNLPLLGDVIQLVGSNSIFVNDKSLDEQLLQRIGEKDVSPASPLPGRSKNLVKGTALQIINEVYAEWSAWLDGLEKNGLEEAWRANILYAEQIEYRINQGTVELSFVLPAGAYATVVLRELVQY